MTGKERDSQRSVDPGDAVPPGVAVGPRNGRADRDRDPGDAVPPGVAPQDPPEPTGEDRRVLEKLRDLPARRG